MLHGLRLLVIFSTVLLLSCAGLKKFPTDKLIFYDVKANLCTEYKIIDFEHFKVSPQGDVKCPAVFGFTSEDIPKVLNWMDDALAYSKQHCQ